MHEISISTNKSMIVISQTSNGWIVSLPEKGFELKMIEEQMQSVAKIMNRDDTEQMIDQSKVNSKQILIPNQQLSIFKSFKEVLEFLDVLDTNEWKQ